MATKLGPAAQRRILSQSGASLATAGADWTVTPSDAVSGSIITSGAVSPTTRLNALPTWSVRVTVPDSWWLPSSQVRPSGSELSSTDQVKLPFAWWATRF